MSTMMPLNQQNIKNWLLFIHEFILKSINDIIILRTTTNPCFFTLPSSQLIKEKSISVLIYFVRRHVRFIVEIWTIKVSILFNSKSRQLSLIKANKKLQTLNKTIVSCLKMLPLFSMFNNKNFDFSFDTEIEIDTQQIIESNNKHELVFNNFSDNIGKVNLTIAYIDKAELFRKEDSIKQSIIQTQIVYATQTIKPALISRNDIIDTNRIKNGIGCNNNQDNTIANGTINGTININSNTNVTTNNVRESYQTFSFSNSSEYSNETNNFEGLKRKSIIDCSLTPYSKEGTELFWEKNEVKNAINRYNRLNNYYCLIHQKTEGDKERENEIGNLNENEEDILKIDDLFLYDFNRYQLTSPSSSFDELELAYIDEDNTYLNEAMKPNKSSKSLQIDEIALKFSLLKEQIQKKKVSINTSMLAKKFIP